jgi:urease accessory protein
MKPSIKTIIFAFISLFLFSTSYAHNTGGIGIESGLIHPIFGLDHLLAMIAVGILGTQIGSKSIWKLPLFFVSFMILGGVLGIYNLQIPMIESGIAFSVVGLGLMIFKQKNTILLSYVLISFFAIFHGNAHGLEIPQITYPAFYVLGFVLSTITLHISGILIKNIAQKADLTNLTLKYSGIVVSIIGIYFLITV